MLRLLLQRKSFQHYGKDYLQTHGTAMRTKMAGSFANIFMTKIETETINQICCANKPLLWKRYIYKRTDIILQSNLQLKFLTKKLLY